MQHKSRCSTIFQHSQLPTLPTESLTQLVSLYSISTPRVSARSLSHSLSVSLALCLTRCVSQLGFDHGELLNEFKTHHEQDLKNAADLHDQAMAAALKNAADLHAAAQAD